MTGTMAHLLFKYVSISAAVLIGLYAGLLGLLTTSFFQAHVVYLHKIQMTWFKDLDVPESFGFMRSQTTPFSIQSHWRSAVRLAYSAYRVLSPARVRSTSGSCWLPLSSYYAMTLMLD